MNGFMGFLENKMMPTMGKVGNNKYLRAVRNGIVMTLPAIISGSLFLVVGNIPIPAWQSFIKPYSAMLGAAVTGSFGIISLLTVMGISYQLCKELDLEPINGAGLATMAFIISSLNDKYVVDTSNFGSTGLFPAIVTAFGSVLIFSFFIRHHLVIKLPAGVPAAVGNSFVALLPGFAILLLFWVIRVPLGFDLNVFVQKLFSPLVFAMDSLPGILVFTLISNLLWVAGIHGDMTLSAIASPIVLQFLAANGEAWAKGQPIPYINAAGFGSLFVNVGGTGATLMLAAWCLTARSKTYRELGKLSIPSAIFEINEPIIFGFPIVMNPVTMIPFVGVPLLLTIGTYILMAIGWVNKPVSMVPWTMPPIIGPMMATGWDWRAGVWSAIELVIGALAWYPFFKVADKQMFKEEENAAQAAA